MFFFSEPVFLDIVIPNNERNAFLKLKEGCNLLPVYLLGIDFVTLPFYVGVRTHLFSINEYLYTLYSHK